jgi:hypothetical protein
MSGFIPPKFVNNVLGIHEFSTVADEPVPTGHTQIRMEFPTDIGDEPGTTVTPDYSARTSRFTGKIQSVRIDLGADSLNHTIDPEEKLRVATARQ